MKINSSTVAMQSSHRYQEVNAQKVTFTARTGTLKELGVDTTGTAMGATGNTQGGGKDAEPAKASGEKGTKETEMAGQQENLLEDWQERFQATVSRVSQSDHAIDTDILTIRQRCIMYILDLLFSRSSSTSMAEQMANRLTSGEDWTSNYRLTWNNTSANYVSLEYQNVYYHSEQEQTAFQTQGKVLTEDGRELDFNINVNMSRSFQAYYQETYQTQLVNLSDPLVINLDTDMAAVSDQTFSFDLDQDGEQEEIHKLNSGSGYLALDKNDDGVINDGSELFGTKSGDGFGDLAEYDEDGNGWIDENDSIFNQLKIWVQDENGQGGVYSLREKGVGAIYLGHVLTDFAQKDEDNQTEAVIRSTGMFLFEDGNAGTVQHLDLAK